MCITIVAERHSTYIFLSSHLSDTCTQTTPIVIDAQQKELIDRAVVAACSNYADLQSDDEDDLSSVQSDDDNSSSEKGTKMPNRLKEPRLIVIDNKETQLTKEHLELMLNDTSDIVRQNVLNLAAWPSEDSHDDAKEKNGYSGVCPALQKLSTERLLARPCIGDDGGLAPELLALGA